MKQRNSTFTSNSIKTDRPAADWYARYKQVYFIWPVWSFQQDWKISKDLSSQGRGGILLEKLGRGVRPASQNPYPIYDQNLQNSLPYLWPDA